MAQHENSTDALIVVTDDEGSLKVRDYTDYTIPQWLEVLDSLAQG